MLFIIAAATALAPIPEELLSASESERVWAIGDLHGDVDCARHWVQRTGLVANLSAPAEGWRWLDPASRLIFMGDYIDRGPSARDVLIFVRALTTRFPHHVHALLGNHELNLLIDRSKKGGDGSRYLEYAYAAAHPAQYPSWMSGDEPDLTLGNTEEVLAMLHEALEIVYKKGLHATVKMIAPPDGEAAPAHSILHFVQPPSARARVAHTLNRWQAAYMRGIGSRTELGAFVHRPLTVHLADTIFVHGGLSEELMLGVHKHHRLPATPYQQERPLGSLDALDELNRRWRDVTQRAGAGAGEVQGETQGEAQGETNAQAEAREAEALARSELVEIASEMVEYRGLHEHYAGRYQDRHLRRATSASDLACVRVEAVCRMLNVSRIAVGHTPENTVRVRCGGRLLALDSTLSRSFRAHGNYYCNAEMEQSFSHFCPKRNERCEGQIVRLERAGAEGSWLLHVVESEWDRERAEGAVDARKVELR